ncbi:MAG: nickel pincer cofactor biosynthesis protein LarC [Acidimicrobiia bacterium]
MTRHLHVDPVSGVSGDMLLGALIDLGASIDHVRADLMLLDLPGWELTAERVTRHGITGTLATVRTTDRADHRAAADLNDIISSAGLSPSVAATARAVIERIAAVEAAIHAVPVDRVHLHEVGALDTIIDVVGVCSALEQLGVATVTCGALPTGSGTVTTAHGELPVPAPATLALIAGTGIVWRFTDDPMELVTPTGAALVAELARPALGTEMDVTAVGYGFGRSTKLARANCCRLVVSSAKPDTVVRLGTTIDDQSPETLAVALEECMAAGALDAWTTPVLMKKARLGSDVTVLCRATDESRLVEILFRHTTTLGIRRATVERHVAERVEHVVDVDGQRIRVKVRRRHDQQLGAKPELDDCAAAARVLGVSVDDVRRRALAALES